MASSIKKVQDLWFAMIRTEKFALYAHATAKNTTAEVGV